jgi:hypothetical protein
MTPLPLAACAGPGVPATHGLVVGVGDYCFVDDPTRPRVSAMGLPRLTSPPVSARLFADWLVSKHRNAAAPLGSVELLLSEPLPRYRSPDGSIDVEVEGATMANFECAWDRWFARCNAHEGNVAIFYFCGHGLHKTHLALLLDDFGENENRMFDNAVDFDASHDGMMTSCRAKVQCFFADACRQVPYAILERENVQGKVLADRIITDNQASDAPRYFATLPTDAAYGQSGQATVFTQAVLQALNGAGSSELNGRWTVQSGRLQDGIREAMRRLQKQLGAPPQRPVQGGSVSGDTILHELTDAPRVPVTVELTPAGAAALAELFLFNPANPAVRFERASIAGSWELELVAGDYYEGGARFPGGAYPAYTWRGMPYPPSVPLSWQVG